jgi:hypothetical protein
MVSLRVTGARTMRKRWLVTLAGAAMLSAPAFASSDDAWDAFRKDVATQCLKAAEPLFATAEATVDPFGSSSYGLALIHGTARGTAASEISAICVYDKKARTVEIGGELPKDE